MHATNLALKAKYSFYAAVVFFLAAHPDTLAMVQWLVRDSAGSALTRGPGGAATPAGLLTQTALFFAAMLALMAF
jgi:hypothetical protein